jgi:hypothetical protein
VHCHSLVSCTVAFQCVDGWRVVGEDSVVSAGQATNQCVTFILYMSLSILCISVIQLQYRYIYIHKYKEYLYSTHVHCMYQYIYIYIYIYIHTVYRYVYSLCAGAVLHIYIFPVLFIL